MNLLFLFTGWRFFSRYNRGGGGIVKSVDPKIVHLSVDSQKKHRYLIAE